MRGKTLLDEGTAFERGHRTAPSVTHGPARAAPRGRRMVPRTSLNSKRRHSSAPLKSGVRRDAASPISLGRRGSAVKMYARQPAKLRLSTSPRRGLYAAIAAESPDRTPDGGCVT